MSTQLDKLTYEQELKDWIKREKSAISLINSVGNLLYDKAVELVLFRNHLVGLNTEQVLQLHDYAQNIVHQPIEPFVTADLAKIMATMSLAPSKIDIGKLASEWLLEKDAYDNREGFLRDKLKNFYSEGDENTIEPRDVVLYGFGRIGRLAARELIKQAGKGQQLRLRAIVVRNTSEDQLRKRMALLQNDSVHGPFGGTIKLDIESKQWMINGQIVKIIEAQKPEDVDYTLYGINNALLIDNTGVYKDREALSRHLQAKGVNKVLLTAPGKGIPNIVYGINHKELNIEEENIYSAASCTTNAISPIIKIIEDNLEIEKGHIETVHAYTNDQNLLDNYHKKNRRGRSAAINMVITETGAGKAVVKVIPALDGKLTANAVRVPTPNGSLAILSLNVKKSINKEDLNKMIKKYALEGDLVNQINYVIDPETVSSDIIGNTCCSVFDSNATIVSADEKNIVLYVWYDNEFGYTKQVIRLAKYIAKVRRLIYY